jgi:hypothetical protein
MNTARPPRLEAAMRCSLDDIAKIVNGKHFEFAFAVAAPNVVFPVSIGDYFGIFQIVEFKRRG